MLDEITALLRNGTWELVPPSSSQNVIGCKSVFRIKRNPDGSSSRYKARLVAKGFHQCPGIDFHDTFSPVVKPTTIRLILAFALSNNWPLHDLIITSNDNKFLQCFLQALATRCSVKDLGDLHYFLGIEVLSTKSGLLLTQHKYIRDLLERTNMVGAKECTMPMSFSQSFQLHDGSPPVNATKFRQVIGAFQYLSLTRLDASYAVNKLAQFMHSPTETHWSVAKRILRYLKYTIYHGLFLQRHQQLCVNAFTDADWAGNRDDRTSTSTYIIYLGGNAISWCSKKQKSVTRSSTEVEYEALASCAVEVLWIQNLLRELQVKYLSSPQIFCDNIGATYLSVNPVFHSHMKHISIDYHFVRDHVVRGSFIVSHISLKDQLADALTKPLSSIIFRQLRSKIGISNGSTVLRGAIRECP
ncbi:Reverse transcriptase [Theobroma cacao]|nr:Reverse transcriptase [Theobroma cacao]